MVGGTAERYDPVTNRWSAVAGMSAGRAGAPAIVLKDGRMLVPGGRTTVSDQVASAEIYDPVANTWSAAGEMNVARSYHDGVLLNDGRVLVVGGDGISDNAKGAE